MDDLHVVGHCSAVNTQTTLYVNDLHVFANIKDINVTIELCLHKTTMLEIMMQIIFVAVSYTLTMVLQLKCREFQQQT